MKLSKLYCNKKKFKNVTFNLKGINVIYSNVKTKEKDKKNPHDLGKTKLLELIDFLLLKEIDKNHFLLKIREGNGKTVFHGHIFYLEILLNNGTFLTIKRTVEKNTKISFSEHQATVKDYTPPLSWNEEDLPIRKAKEKLASFINLDFFKDTPYDYRKGISYSLRTPPVDYADVYQLSKFGKSKDLDWKPFMFDLLGFKGKLLAAKYKNDKKAEDILQNLESYKRDYSINEEDRDDYVAQLKILETKAKEVETQIDSFNFYEQDKELISKGIEEFEASISNLNTMSYNLNFEIDRLRRSVRNKFAFDLNKVKKTFEESNIYFPDQLKQDYNELLTFNSKLTVERNRMLNEALDKKNRELMEVNRELKRLNKKTENLLSFLQDTDSFKKFKFYQKELSRVESQLAAIKEKIDSVDKVIKKEEECSDLKKEIEGTVKNIREIFQHTGENERYSDIRTKFAGFYKHILNEDARISWKINESGNVEFVSPKVRSRIDSKKETAKDEGNTYKKLLCVAFDLAILCSYNNESYFRFVYHDDVLSNQDNGIKLRLLELIKDLSSRFDLQYIFSVIKSDLPHDSSEKFIYFNDDETVLKLHDKDESGTLFGFEF